MKEFIGACGKILTTLCYPNFEDDLCASCSFNVLNEDDLDIK